MAEQIIWMTIKEIAESLRVDDETVRRWIRNKEMKAYRFGRDYKVKKEDFDTFVQEHAVDS